MNIYVGNLSFDATETDVENAFGEFGDVQSVNIIKDRDTGRSRGFAFVEMGSKGDADAAIKALDGSNLEQITFTEGFDGFPMFSPDGKWLAFGSNRNQAKHGDTDVYVARWVETPPPAKD